MNIEALKEAHDLSLDGRDFAARQIILDVIANLEKEALSEPEQEPVAWMYERDTQAICTEFSFSRFDTEGRKGWNETPLYTTPPQRTWVSLTDKEIEALWTSLHDDFGNPPSATGYERAIEAKLKNKNTRGQE